MAIDNIKPVGGAPVPSTSADEVAGKPDRAFTEVQDKARAAAAGATPSSLSVVSQFSQADLQDPAKLDQAVRASVTEMVNSQQMPGPLSNSDKSSLVDFLSSDPMIRQQVENYLRKALP